MKIKIRDLEPGLKVRFRDSYSGTFRDFKDKTLTIDYYYAKDECMETNGRVRIKELLEVEPHHLVNPEWLEEV